MVSRLARVTGLGNLDLLRAPVTVVTPPAGATYRLFADGQPLTTGDSDNGSVSLGLEFAVTAACTLTQILWFQPTTVSGAETRTVGLFSTVDGSSGTLLGSKSQAPSGVGWQTVALDAPLALSPGVRYVAVTYHPAGHYSATGSYFKPGQGPAGSGMVVGPITVPASQATTGPTGNGRYGYATGISYPNNSFESANYWVDIVVAT